VPRYVLCPLLSAASRTFSLRRASLTGFVDLAVGTGGPETFFSAISGLQIARQRS
jgi:Ca2+/Na+ antiporter